MLTPQQIQEIRQKAGLNPIQIKGTSENFVGKYDYLKPAEQKESIFDKISNAFSKRVSSVTQSIKDTSTGDITPARATFQTTGQVAGLVGDILGIGLDEVTPEPIKKKIEEVATNIMENETAKSVMESYASFKQKHPQAAKDLESGVNILALLPIGKAGQVAGKGIKVGAEAVETGVKSGVKVGTEVIETGIDKAKNVLSAKPLTAKEAVGQILQGSTKDVKSGVAALSQIDTAGVKTFKDLSEKMSSKIGELAKQVDADLAIDTSTKKLKDLTIGAKTLTGKLVKVEPVKNALNQLDELYSKIGDVVKQADIKDLINKARTVGLTNQEINNLAREYGKEFSTKAFNKVGDALTSVNAQMFENTRKSLKSLARQGIKGSEAQFADKAMSAIYDTQRLVDKSVQAVNKLQQKIKQRGLLEKVGHTVSKYADVLTGGSIRGIVGGLLPRGAGYKVMNALDIQDMLEKNLKVIQEAIKSGSDKDIIDILKNLEVKTKPLPKAEGEILLTNKTVKLNPLIQEAKKYKSAEEFVKANLEVDTLLPSNRPKGEKTLADLKYTGSKVNTQKAKVSPIEDVINKAKSVADSGGDGSVGNYEVYDVLKKVKNGRIKVYHGTSEKGANSIGGGWAGLKDGSYLSLTKGADKEAMGVYGAKYYADIAEKYGKGGQVLEFDIPLKNVAIDNVTGELRYVSDKTKSQLTDIWNKANK